MTESKKNIVIVGGGFAGVRAALDLQAANSQDVRMVLIDQNTYHLFTPWLYEQASTADVPKRQLRIPYSTIFHNKPVEFVRGEVIDINRDKKIITLRSDQRIPYDALILACGSVPNTYNIPGVTKHALMLKTIEDAKLIRETVLNKFAKFIKSHQPGDVFQVIVAGGGPTGTELTAQLHSYLKELARRLEHDDGTFLIKLVDSGDSLLRGFPTFVGAQAQRRLGSYRRLEILLQHTVSLADSRKVHMKTGDELAYDVLIWTGGIQAHKLVVAARLETNNCQQAKVKQTMQSITDPAVFVVGDAAFCTDPNATVRSRASVENAYLQGQIAATNTLRFIENQPLIPSTQRSYGNIFPLKDSWAISTLLGFQLTGKLAYWLMLLINLRYLLWILPMRDAFKRWLS